jgi:hypothetical protein
MTEHNGQTITPPGAIPARIELEDFIEAVTRGVARALAAQEEVSGYLFKPGDGLVGTEAETGQPVLTRGGATMGLIFNFNLPRS